MYKTKKLYELITPIDNFTVSLSILTFINTLEERLKNGERTQELYDEIMKLK